MTYGNCDKKHRVVGAFTTNTSVPGHESWDLRPYKTAGIGKPCGTWRLIEVVRIVDEIVKRHVAVLRLEVIAHQIEGTFHAFLDGVLFRTTQKLQSGQSGS